MIQNGQSYSTEQQEEALATFRAVTAIEDDDQARRILESFSWDLDQAVSSFLDDPHLIQSQAPHQSSRRQSERGSQSGIVTDGSLASQNRTQLALAPPQNSTAPQNASPNGLPFPRVPRWIFVMLSPFRFLWSFVSNMTSKLMHLLSGPAHLIESAPGDTPTRRFLSFYESRYGNAHPTFFDGSYLSALATANSQLKFLLVYIHSESHRLTSSFCRSVLANESFISTANDSFITWAGSITQRDAAAAHHALRAPALPFMAVVAAPSQPGSMDIARAQFGTLLSLRAGPSLVTGGAQAATTWLTRVLQRHTPLLDAVRAQRMERESARMLRQQQDEEFAASLEADQRKEREAEEERAREESYRKRLEDLEVRRVRKKEALGEEPEKGPGIASIVLRLPDGTRVGRRFIQNDALEKVFDWAEVNGVDIEVACLIIPFPRKIFRYPEDADVKIGDAGLFPSCMLLLEERSE